MADENGKPMNKQELIEALGNAEVRVKQAYEAGVQAARDFDKDMDGFLVNFLRKDYSSIVIFAIAGGLVSLGILIGSVL